LWYRGEDLEEEGFEERNGFRKVGRDPIM
jgi:hypothetical protein